MNYGELWSFCKAWTINPFKKWSFIENQALCYWPNCFSAFCVEGQWNQGGGPSAGGEQTQTQVTIPKDVSNIYQGLQYQNGNFYSLLTNFKPVFFMYPNASYKL